MWFDPYWHQGFSDFHRLLNEWFWTKLGNCAEETFRKFDDWFDLISPNQSWQANDRFAKFPCLHIDAIFRSENRPVILQTFFEREEEVQEVHPVSSCRWSGRFLKIHQLSVRSPHHKRRADPDDEIAARSHHGDKLPLWIICKSASDRYEK
jgi:hypothetical protein